MTAATPRVYISVLNWNNPDQTMDCLKSLEMLEYENYRVIVVDNASRDASAARIRQAFPQVELIHAESNLGYAGGNELALRRALADGETELFWILNSDAQAAPDSLRQMVSAWQQFGDALYGGVSLTSDSQRRLNFMLWDYQGHSLYARNYHGLTYEETFANPQPRVVPSLHGSSLLIPLSVVRQHGFMQTDFFLYSEESDYCLRLHKQGVKSVLVPASVIYHIGSGTRKNRPQMDGIIEYYRARNRLVLYRRHSTLLAYLALCGSYLLRALHKSLLNPRTSGLLWRALFDGIRGRMGKPFAPEDYLELAGVS